MKTCIWGLAVLVLLGAVARAGDGVGVLRGPASSVYAEEHFAAGAALAPTLSPPAAESGCVASGWEQFRHGCLWTDYCSEPPCSEMAATPVGSCPEGCGTSWLRSPWPSRSAAKKPCRVCRARRATAWDRLCNLFGWERRPSLRVACHARVECPEPAVHVPLDDPAPLPPTPVPAEDPDATLQEAHPERDLPTQDMLPVEPDLIPEKTGDPDDAPGAMELPPTPPDDPAPAPQPEIPRNKLPPVPPAPASSARSVKSRTTLVSRLSDFIHTR